MGVIRLAVDAMGGDYAPGEIVAGAVQGARDLGLRLLLVGDPGAIQEQLSGLQTNGLGFEIVPSPDVIRMEEHPAQAVRARPGASINVACNLVLDGRADGVLSMGHTGAGMIAALLNFGRIPGVERPAALVPFLGLRQDLYLLDAGANTEVRPQHLLQFAHMGSAYAEYAAQIPHPRLALLSNGVESNKGNKIGQEAYTLLEASDLNFVGNIEGHTLLSSDVNVVIADGFAGNIILKLAEGIAASLLDQAQEVVEKLPEASGELVKRHLNVLREKNDYAHYGVSTLLGVQHPIFIGHGRSKAAAVRYGMATARRMIAGGVIDRIRQALAS
jgi:glycerol-3-phosphate acyltransferase PlsX